MNGPSPKQPVAGSGPGPVDESGSAEPVSGPGSAAARPGGERLVGVTGAAGRLGRAVLADLAAHGLAAVGADRVTADGVESWDGRDLARLAELFAGCTDLIHLAAIPSPWNHPDEVVFGDNTTATFAALTVAGRLGIRRAVIASSGSAYGFAWSERLQYAHYVPLDEAHPMDNADPYGLSKEVDERTAEMASRRWEMSVAALRFHWIADREMQHAALEGMRGAERNWIEELRGLWGYVDLRDAASACRVALDAAVRSPYGFQPMNIVAADALSEQPIAELLTEHGPHIEIRGTLGPTQGAYAIDRAREVIGWVPQHSWRDEE